MAIYRTNSSFFVVIFILFYFLFLNLSLKSIFKLSTTCTCNKFVREYVFVLLFIYFLFFFSVTMFLRCIIKIHPRNQVFLNIILFEMERMHDLLSAFLHFYFLVFYILSGFNVLFCFVFIPVIYDC